MAVVMTLAKRKAAEIELWRYKDESKGRLVGKGSTASATISPWICVQPASSAATLVSAGSNGWDQYHISSTLTKTAAACSPMASVYSHSDPSSCPALMPRGSATPPSDTTEMAS